MIKIKKGNIFTTNCQTIVNAVNCKGVMGAGIAYEFRLRYQDMFEKYKNICLAGKMKIGFLRLYKGENRQILNFPTKDDRKYPSKIEYIEKGLQKFMETYHKKGITSIAFPVLGTGNGGINEDKVLNIMKRYLKDCNILIEIYHYDPIAEDDLFNSFRKSWLSLDERIISNKTSLRIDFVKKISNILKTDNIKTINGLLSTKGIGHISLEKAFHFAMNFKHESNDIGKLF